MKTRKRIKPRDPSNEYLRKVGHRVMTRRNMKRLKDRKRREIQEAIEE